MFIYLVCLLAAVIDESIGLGLVGLIGLATWVWQVRNRHRPVVQLTREEALAQMAAKKGRYLSGVVVAAASSLLLGTLALLAGRHDRDGFEVGWGTALVLFGVWFLVMAIRLHLKLRKRALSG